MYRYMYIHITIHMHICDLGFGSTMATKYAPWATTLADAGYAALRRNVQRARICTYINYVQFDNDDYDDNYTLANDLITTERNVYVALASHCTLR
jgi:hypothetical protein